MESSEGHSRTQLAAAIEGRKKDLHHRHGQIKDRIEQLQQLRDDARGRDVQACSVAEDVAAARVRADHARDLAIQARERAARQHARAAQMHEHAADLLAERQQPDRGRVHRRATEADSESAQAAAREMDSQRRR